MKTNNINVEKGYITLITVLIVGAVSLAASLSLLTMGIDSQRSAALYLANVEARAYSRTCAEYALMEIQKDENYSGNGAATGCTYTVTILSPKSYKIDVVSTTKNVSHKLDVRATINLLSVSVTSWKEVA